jgi:hypothetical protein
MLREQIDAKILAEAARIAEDRTVEHAMDDPKAEKEPMAPHTAPNGVLADTLISLGLSMRQALKQRPDLVATDRFLIGVIATGLSHGIYIGMEYERLKNGGVARVPS